ncbi:MAG: NUDIX hydrolase [Pseudomonadota bacterium]
MPRYVPSSDEERAFLAAYRKKKYPRPAVSADVAAFTWRDATLAVLLIRRGNFPHRGSWAFPGGFVEVGDCFDDQGEDLAAAASRELHEECGIAPGSVSLRQLATFGSPDRDPRTRLITVVHLAILPPAAADQARPGDDAAHAEWVPLASACRLPLAFDHADILRAAVDRLQADSAHTSILAPLVPRAFTRRELRDVHAAVWGQGFDARRFAVVFRRLLADGIVNAMPAADPPRYRFGRPARQRPI